MQGEPARRREGLGAFVRQTGPDQGIGHQGLEIIGGAPLHARGDFLAEKFKQEIGHWNYIAFGRAGSIGSVGSSVSKSARSCHPLLELHRKFAAACPFRTRAFTKRKAV